MCRKLDKALVLVLVALLFGCKSDYTQITISNNTPKKIEKVGVTSYGVNVVFNNLEPGSEVTKKVFIKDIRNYEGGFYVIVFSDGEIKNSQILGYFANSSDIKSRYNFIIDDRFMIKEK